MDTESEDEAKAGEYDAVFAAAWWEQWPPPQRWGPSSLYAFVICRNDWIADGASAPLEEWIARWLQERE